MSVSLDGLRRNATRAFNNIVEYLNESEYLQDWEREQLQEDFDDLRFALAVLNASSVPKVEHFNDMSEELKFVDFNPNNDERS